MLLSPDLSYLLGIFCQSFPSWEFSWPYLIKTDICISSLWVEEPAANRTYFVLIHFDHIILIGLSDNVSDTWHTLGGHNQYWKDPPQRLRSAGRPHASFPDLSKSKLKTTRKCVAFTFHFLILTVCGVLSFEILWYDTTIFCDSRHAMLNITTIYTAKKEDEWKIQNRTSFSS